MPVVFVFWPSSRIHHPLILTLAASFNIWVKPMLSNIILNALILSSQKCSNWIRSTPVYLESQMEMDSLAIYYHHPKFKLIRYWFVFAINCREVHSLSKKHSDSDLNLGMKSVGVQTHWLEVKNLKECSIEFKKEDSKNEHRGAVNSPTLDLQKEADANLEEDKIQSFLFRKKSNPK